MARYSEALQRYLNRDDLTLKTSAAETVTTTQSAVELGDKSAMTLVVVISAASGTTPTLLVTIEGSDDNITWHTIARIGSNGYVLGDVVSAPSNFTTTTTGVFATMPADRYVRSKSTIGGTTPSFTYSVAGSSVG